jgi:hypothetical protein
MDEHTTGATTEEERDGLYDADNQSNDENEDEEDEESEEDEDG